MDHTRIGFRTDVHSHESKGVLLVPRGGCEDMNEVPSSKSQASVDVDRDVGVEVLVPA
jgi:hypothetical protein